MKTEFDLRPYYRYLYCIIPLILAAATFSVTLNDSFTNWDDTAYVTDNPLIRSLSFGNICTIFSPGTFVCNNYQPVTILSLAVNYALGHLNPEGYIASNILLHLINVFLVFIFIRKLSRSDPVASLCALLFGIHPMHVESVAWVTGRKDLLFSVFYLSSLLWYLRYLEKTGRERRAAYCIVFVLLVLSLLSKSAAVTLPVVFLLLDQHAGRKISTRCIVEKLPFLVPAIVLGIVAIVGQQADRSLNLYSGLPVMKRVLVGCYSFMFYTIRFFAPVRLSAFYPYPASLPGALPPTYLLAPVICAVTAGLAYLGRRSKVIIFGFFFFLVNIVFILHFVPVGRTVTADRFSYLAYIGLSYIVAHYAGKVFSANGMIADVAREFAPKARREAGKEIRNPQPVILNQAAYAAFGIIVAGMACFGSFRRCEAWKDSVSLWKDAVSKYPCAMSYNSLGLGLMAEGRTGEAIAQFRKALELSPGSAQTAQAYINLGDACLKMGLTTEAVADCSKAVELAPDSYAAHNNLGSALLRAGNPDEAIVHFRKAMELAPGDAEVQNNLGAALLQSGRVSEAIDHFRAATDLDTGNAVEQNILATVLAKGSRTEEAVEHFQKAVEISPDFAEAHSNLGSLLEQTGRITEAIGHLRKAAELKPDDASVQNRLGYALVNSGMVNEAIDHFRRALALDPGNAEAFFYLTKTYIATGHFFDAIACLQGAIAMNPRDLTTLNDLTAAFAQTGQVDSAIATARKVKSLALASGDEKIARETAEEIGKLQRMPK